MVVLIVCRDLAITGLRGIAASQNVIIQASDFGKATMIAEVIAVALLILNYPAMAAPLGKTALAVAILLSLASGAAYFQKFWRRIDLAK
jgi:CDP-diacylglycerol--glycerol-3-phosphate 3-phosphatidyltransferase